VRRRANPAVVSVVALNTLFVVMVNNSMISASAKRMAAIIANMPLPLPLLGQR
jgi:hypothetical protein